MRSRPLVSPGAGSPAPGPPPEDWLVHAPWPPIRLPARKVTAIATAHPILVTVPIGAWVASLVFDIASHLTTGPGFLARGSLWLIGIGVIGALIAAWTGFLDLLAIPAGTRAYRTANVHMTLNLVVTSAYAVGFVWRYGGYHHPGPVPAGQLALSAASLVALAVSGYLGGKLAYRYGVRVADEASQGTGYTSPAAAVPAQWTPTDRT